MKILNDGNVIRLPLDQIKIGARLRRVSDAQVENLLLMAEDTGITTPVHVRKVGSAYELIDGAHRLEAARRLGLPDIACLAVECRQDEARAMEASNNLGAARMTPLQTVVFAASWKRDYYALHPERKPGVFKGNRHTGSLVSDCKSAPTRTPGIPGNSGGPLTVALCEAFGIGERRAHRILSVGERLTVAEVGLLERAARNVALDELEALSKVNDLEERLAVVKALAADPKARVTATRRKLAAEHGAGQPDVNDPSDAACKALSAAWTRAGAIARRRFVETHWDELVIQFANGRPIAPQAAEAAE